MSKTKCDVEIKHSYWLKLVTWLANIRSVCVILLHFVFDIDSRITIFNLHNIPLQTKQNKTKKLRKRLLFSLRKISEIYFSKQISSTFYALGILKMGQPRHLFNLFLSFQTNNTNLTTNKCENVHPVSGAGIRTHNLLITSLLPEPLDQGSRPRFRNL